MPTPVPAPAGFTSHAASVNNLRLHYWLGGDPAGPPVLLWHGFLGTSLEWRKVMPLLAAAGYAVFVPDMPDCSHFLPEEHPEAVGRHVRALHERATKR